jgi:hypothetical protein
VGHFQVGLEYSLDAIKADFPALTVNTYVAHQDTGEVYFILSQEFTDIIDAIMAELDEEEKCTLL